MRWKRRENGKTLFFYGVNAIGDEDRRSQYDSILAHARILWLTVVWTCLLWRILYSIHAGRYTWCIYDGASMMVIHMPTFQVHGKVRILLSGLSHSCISTSSSWRRTCDSVVFIGREWKERDGFSKSHDARAFDLLELGARRQIPQHHRTLAPEAVRPRHHSRCAWVSSGSGWTCYWRPTALDSQALNFGGKTRHPSFRQSLNPSMIPWIASHILHCQHFETPSFTLTTSSVPAASYHHHLFPRHHAYPPQSTLSSFLSILLQLNPAIPDPRLTAIRQ